MRRLGREARRPRPNADCRLPNAAPERGSAGHATRSRCIHPLFLPPRVHASFTKRSFTFCSRFVHALFSCLGLGRMGAPVMGVQLETPSPEIPEKQMAAAPNPESCANPAPRATKFRLTFAPRHAISPTLRDGAWHLAVAGELGLTKHRNRPSPPPGFPPAMTPCGARAFGEWRAFRPRSLCL